ncbi:MAG: DUF3592 domain-containing protein [Gemmatimonadaceae bacterium]|nr:DUF3592 domain-containing protein [Gemmatimonadaceae bacterium]
MRVIEETSERLVIHDSPAQMRAMGAAFAALGIGVLVLVGTKGDHAPNVWVAYVVGTTFAAIGGAMLVAAADRYFLFERKPRLVRTTVRTLRRTQVTEYPFDRIRDIALERSTSTQRTNGVANVFYRIVFVLTDGTRVPWTSVSTGDGVEQARVVAAARAIGGWARTADALPVDAPAADAATRAATAISTRGLALVIAFLSIFILVGGWLMVLQLHRVRSWRPVPATVISTSVTTVRSRNQTTYRPVVQYRYEVDGRAYESTRVTALTVSRGYAWAQGEIAKYRPGTTTTAYLDPTDPEEAFLDPAISLLPLIFVVLPLLIVAVLVRGARATQRRAQQALALGVPVVDQGTMVLRSA